VIALLPHLQSEVEGINHTLLPCPLEFHVNANESPCATHTSTAVYGERLVAAVGVRSPDPTEEVEERSGMAGDTKVRPREEVVLTNFTSFIRIRRFDLEVAHRKVSKIDGILESDSDVGITLGTLVRPVLCAFYLHLFHEVGEHHNGGYIVVPDESPEVSHCVR